MILVRALEKNARFERTRQSLVRTPQTLAGSASAGGDDESGGGDDDGDSNDDGVEMMTRTMISAVVLGLRSAKKNQHGWS